MSQPSPVKLSPDLWESLHGIKSVRIYPKGATLFQQGTAVSGVFVVESGQVRVLLPTAQRAVLVLRYLEDLPESQVAEILGCSVGTVRSQTHKAITQLRMVLPSLGLTSTEVHQ